MYRFHELYRYMMGMINGIVNSPDLSDHDKIQRIQALFEQFFRARDESLLEEEKIRNTMEKGKW